MRPTAANPLCVSGFNPRPRAGGDCGYAPIWHACYVFQSTPPRGGRRIAAESSPLSPTCFNPRPRAGGDGLRSRVGDRLVGVSIHAPARGATQERARISRASSGFNPRPRAGGDQHLWLTPSLFRLIHAPARGATALRANPSVSGPALEAALGIIRKCCRSSNGLRSGRKVRLFGSRFGFALAASAQPGGFRRSAAR